MAPFPWQLVTFDIDGTLTTVHGWRRIAERFGRVADFESTSRRFVAGEIGEDAHLTNLMQIAEGRTVPEVESILEDTPRLAGISEAVASLRSRGACVALLTHNPPYVCAWYVRRFGFDDFEGTTGQSMVGGRIGAPRGVHADKPGGLRRLLVRHGIPPRAAIHVGDQISDADIFPHIGGGIALNSSDPRVNDRADRAVRATDLREVVQVLLELSPRPG
ncbi:MAG: HAD family hydrolase [Thermoplasmata archaeon]